MWEWTRLTKAEIGRIAELFVQIEFLRHCWQVLQPVLDVGADLVVITPSGEKNLFIQVKGRRGLPYVVHISRRLVP